MTRVLCCYFPFKSFFPMLTYWNITYPPHQNHIYRRFWKLSLFLWFWCNGIRAFSTDFHCFCIPYDPCSHGGIIGSPYLCPSYDYLSVSHTATSTTLYPHITYIRTNFLSFQHHMSYVRASTTKDAQKVARTKKNYPWFCIPLHYFHCQILLSYYLPKIHNILPIPHFAFPHV